MTTPLVRPRFLKASVVVFVLLLPFVILEAWDYVETRRLATSIAKMRERHEPVITGTITYPVASGLLEPDNTGRLYVARALLWPEMPYELLSYAAQNPTFPHDSTGDQWFDDGGFGAYTQLGRELGTQVLQIRQAERSRHPTGALSANETALPPQEVSDDNRATGGRRRGGLERRRCWRGFGHRRSRPDS